MEVPYIGPVEKDDQFDWYVSKPKPMPCLRGHRCKFVLQDYAEDYRKADFHEALKNVLITDDAILHRAQPHVLRYCREMLELYADAPGIRVDDPADVWRFVRFGSELYVQRRADGDDEDGVYLSLECGCDWEIEHGLQLVMRNGLEITKVGPYDGHLTNSDAFADPNLKGVVYKGVS